MANPEHQDQEAEDEPARVSGEEAQAEQGEHRAPADVELSPAEERAGDVAPVELARGKEVDRGHEQTDPTREGEGMHHEGIREREELGEQEEQERGLDEFPTGGG